MRLAAAQTRPSVGALYRVRDRPWISQVTRQVVPSASVRASAKLPRMMPVPGSISTRKSASVPSVVEAPLDGVEMIVPSSVSRPGSLIVPLTAADGDASGGLSDSVPVARSRACVSTSVVGGDAVDRVGRRADVRARVDAGGDAARAGPRAGEVGRGAHRQRRGVGGERRRGSSCCRRRAP